MCPIDLVKPPEQILGRPIHVITARIVGEVVAQRRTRKLLAEQIDFVQEQDNTGALEPPRVDDRIEENQAFHHSILPAVRTLVTVGPRLV